MTSTAHRFCAEESLAVGDPLAGTATHAERNLLISWPRARWRRSLRRANDMPGAVASAIESIADAGCRVNLIHRHDQPSHQHRVFLLPENQAYDVPREQLTDFLWALDEGGSLSDWHQGAITHSLVLCCTHGKKDKCCAKFGYGTYKALAEAARTHGYPFDVWESTHLGGCRLAASAVVFPALRKYGRITARDVVPLLDSEMAGRPYLPCYRGDAGLSPVQQCAEVAALEWLQAQGISADVSVENPPPDSDASSIRLLVGWQHSHLQGWLQVACQAQELLRYDTCADHDSGGPTSSRVWQALDVTPIAGQ